MKRVFYILLIAFSSCYTQKKAEKQIAHAFIEYPKVVADKSREWFPCIMNTADTIAYRFNDSTIVRILRFQDTTRHIITDKVFNNSSNAILIRQLNESSRLIDFLKSEFNQRKPIIVKDSAEIYLLKRQIDTLQYDKEKYRVGNEKKLKWIVLLIAFNSLLLFIYILRNEIFRKGGFTH